MVIQSEVEAGRDAWLADAQRRAARYVERPSPRPASALTLKRAPTAADFDALVAGIGMTIGRERMAWQRRLLEAERRIGELEWMLEKSG